MKNVEYMNNSQIQIFTIYSIYYKDAFLMLYNQTIPIKQLPSGKWECHLKEVHPELLVYTT